MTYTVPATFCTPVNKAGAVRITFEIDDAVRDTVAGLINSKMGKQYLLVAFEIGGDAKEIESAYTDPNFTKKKLLKQVHAIIGEYCVETGVSDAKIKRLLKLSLQSKGILKESMAELDEQGLAVAIHTLQLQLNPRVFNYAEHLHDKT